MVVTLFGIFTSVSDLHERNIIGAIVVTPFSMVTFSRAQFSNTPLSAPLYKDAVLYLIDVTVPGIVSSFTPVLP